MSDETNKNLQEETADKVKTADEVVDDIPENAKNINENTQKTYSSLNVEAVTSENSLMSIISIVLGVFSIICCCFVIPPGISAIVGFILGILAYKGNSSNKNLAIIGIILCSIGLAIFLVACALMVIFGSINTVIEIPHSISRGYF